MLSKISFDGELFKDKSLTLQDESSWEREWWALHNNVNALNTTKLHT